MTEKCHISQMKTLPYERFDDVVTFNCEVNRSTAIDKLYRGSYMIDFIKRVEEKRYNARLAEHFISLSQRVY